jgi:hypothetical protein
MSAMSWGTATDKEIGSPVTGPTPFVFFQEAATGGGQADVVEDEVDDMAIADTSGGVGVVGAAMVVAGAVIAGMCLLSFAVGRNKVDAIDKDTAHTSGKVKLLETENRNSTVMTTRRGGIGGRVECLKVTRAEEVERIFEAARGYDCAIVRPLSSGPVRLRLEAKIEGPLDPGVDGPPGNWLRRGPLVAPLTRRDCVLYTAAVSRPLHEGEGIPPVPVSFAAVSLEDFAIVLLGDDTTERVRVRLRGEDVCLFDIRGGRFSTRRAFAAAPDHWQDFMMTHRASGAGKCTDNSTSALDAMGVLEFHEYALAVGATVTVTGELQRDVDGVLSLLPRQDESIMTVDEPSAARVFVSDDPTLIVGHKSEESLAEKFLPSMTVFN